ncbi:MAG: N-acetylneuraminate synthase family protein [Acidiferrobacteraceae bacterium]
MNFEQFLSNAGKNLFIIAEAGVNHNGDLETAFRLVDAAVSAGCDAVKFQTWVTEKVYSRDKSIKPNYQARTTDAGESVFDTIRNLELSYEDFGRVKRYCDQKGILFFSTPDETESADFLADLGVELIKTASQDVTNVPFLAHVARLRIPLIFSTGACTLTELAEGVEAILAETNELVILHCVSSYPAPMEQMNLSVIPNLQKMFGCPVGLSDHTAGAEAACASVALGARIFEKHLTLDKSMSGPDHQASLTPEEMRQYCRSLRSVRTALGDGIKRIMPCEEDTRRAFRRFAVAARDLPAGTVLGARECCFKKVVDGISPRHLDLILGSRLVCDLAEDTVLTWAMLQRF